MLMIKDRVKTIINQCNEDIKPKFREIENINAKDYYTGEYKRELRDKVGLQIKEIKQKAFDNIMKEFDKKLESIPKYEISGLNNPETSNILKMLELSKNNLSIYEIQELAEKYIDNMAVYKVIESMAKAQNIKIIENPKKNKILEIRELKNRTESLKETFYNGLKQSINVLDMNLGGMSVDMIFANDEEF
ncbi:MAG: hypothetical protein E6038_00005 [Clostridium perfringens]|nr:hypothetical protein [Clostridium perfringens]